jgi:large subunit ribosomal protein L18
MRVEKKQQLARRRHWRVRRKVRGTAERPRMAVRFTNQNIHVQFIDDTRV